MHSASEQDPSTSKRASIYPRISFADVFGIPFGEKMAIIRLPESSRFEQRFKHSR